VKGKWLAGLLVLPLLLSSQSAAALEYPNRYRSMAESLFDMMDAFSSAYQKRLHERARDYAPPPAALPGYPGYPPGAAGSYPGMTDLNGSWQGESGEVLVIRGDRFRIYQDRQNYRQGRLASPQPGLLLLQEQQSGQVRPYRFAESEGRLMLLDPGGLLLRYIRVGW